jgi:UDP-3-O-[3-hydroxymyristoyl] glucosamine N-acyltransferase
MRKFVRALPEATTAAELARRLSARVEISGDGARAIRGIAGLSNAEVDALSFCDSTEREVALADTGASVVIVATECAAMPRLHQTFLRVDDVRASFIAAVDLLLPGTARPHEPAPGIDPRARVDGTAEISSLAAIGAGVSIGPGTRVGPGAVIYEDCAIGAQCVIGPNAVIGWVGLAYHDCRDGQRLFFPHLGRVRIGDRVDVGANACICRGMLSDTIIGDQAKIGSLVYVGHGVEIEANAWLSAATAIAGHSSVNAHALLGIGAVVVDNVAIGARAVLGAGSVVTKDVGPGDTQFGVPAHAVPKARRFGPTPRE